MTLLRADRRRPGAEDRRLTGEQVALVLAAARIAVGIGGYLFPGLLARMFGAPTRSNPSVPFVIRAFATRDIVLGVGLAGSSPGPERDRWLVLGALVDVFDATAALLALRRRQIPAVNAAVAAVTASGAALAGVRAHQG